MNAYLDPDNTDTVDLQSLLRPSSEDEMRSLIINRLAAMREIRLLNYHCRQNTLERHPRSIHAELRKIIAPPSVNRYLCGTNALNTNQTKENTPILNTMSPGTRAQTSVCMMGLCMNSADRANEYPCSMLT